VHALVPGIEAQPLVVYSYEILAVGGDHHLETLAISIAGRTKRSTRSDNGMPLVDIFAMCLICWLAIAQYLYM